MKNSYQLYYLFFTITILVSLTRVTAFGKKCKTLRDLLLTEDNTHENRNARSTILGLNWSLPNLLKDKFLNDNEDPSNKKKPKKVTWRDPGKVPKNLKIAIYGDLGIKKKSYKVLRMVDEWGADGIIFTGDYDYEDRPDKFRDMIEATTNKDTVIFAAVGNHDIVDWTTKNGYQEYFIGRLHRQGLSRNCIGEYGINSICGWNGINILLSGVGTMGYGHVDFVEDTLALAESNWKICAFHKCQTNFQTGKKKDQTGYGIYDMCRRFGAIVATSHVHSYSRSKLITHYKKTKYLNQTDQIDIHIKTSLNIVSGIGGYSVDKYFRDLKDNPWWASTLSKSDGVKAGAVLCTFHVDDDPTKAVCEFRGIDGKVYDKWTVNSHIKKERRRKREPKDLKQEQKTTGIKYSNSDPENNKQYGNVKQHPFKMIYQQNSEINFNSNLIDDSGNGIERDMKEFSINSNHDIAIGTLKTGFFENCNLHNVPISIQPNLLPDKNIKSTDIMNNAFPITLLQFTNVKLSRNEDLSVANLQVLGVRDKHLENVIASMEKSGLDKGNEVFVFKKQTLQDDIDIENVKNGSTDDKIDDDELEDGNEESDKNSLFLEIRVVQNKHNIQFCSLKEKKDNWGKDMIDWVMEKVEPVLWQVRNTKFKGVYLSSDLGAKIKEIVASKDWNYGDTIDMFISPSRKHHAEGAKIPEFMVYGHAIQGGCMAPTLVIYK
ncbi:hypothetical protein BB559_001476 [Furculomyces boomerangus]|uniref:Calcineurin-like phosphoesterase domain-containing protein n=2 Tax=Harpellales TaxID=61421 RepID=A0A2T9Z1T3_9FUNG|nr:hypothetical protein BB559_001476 [Furculomyces boomerangus]PVZ98518.1 hypothetical protein BB558_005474 [Smittium angustum]